MDMGMGMGMDMGMGMSMGIGPRYIQATAAGDTVHTGYCYEGRSTYRLLLRVIQYIQATATGDTVHTGYCYEGHSTYRLLPRVIQYIQATATRDTGMGMGIGIRWTWAGHGMRTGTGMLDSKMGGSAPVPLSEPQPAAAGLDVSPTSARLLQYCSLRLRSALLRTCLRSNCTETDRRAISKLRSIASVLAPSMR
ncbi:hypothetical protein AC579_8452 [Pseudocercospora musae]|uniref:Uncharacterized protein n=1 Tax=Pseudocercospora musae TaxID=113226 RepID=A0A139GVV2_9PEZI|nr:hypothetical protein AC579_8452 [Pseudocercospora musae]